MTPKEKAKELIEMFIGFASDEDTTEDGFVYSEEIRLWKAKQCAVIAAKEIKEAIDWHKYAYPIEEHDYWEKVEQEIQNL